ncbi:MAG: 50S ribosome-binding GTPase [Candidatus Omnitrophica bacterium]|nr:50S ribosome-binding GTPase [Candidatus Omnitrophota bacterium]
MIIDRVSVFVRAGKGGDGAASFFRHGHTRTPDGGDGGRGGDVVFVVDSNLYDLSKFRKSKRYKASGGGDGGPQRKHGRDGETLLLHVPCGTIIRDHQEDLLADLLKEDERFFILHGAPGGEGSCQHGQAQCGSPGEEKEVILDYRIPNDVAFVGFANTGKTSLVNALSGQNYKVAAYPFTTSHCRWAVCEYKFKRFTVLDTPPVTAHDDLREEVFLKHLSRSKIIVVVSDNKEDMQSQRRIIEEKLARFDPEYLKKKFFYLFSKIDTIKRDFRVKKWLPVSVTDRETIDTFITHILKELYEDKN